MKKILTLTTMLCALNLLPAMAFAHGDENLPFLENAISSLPSDQAEDFRDTLQQAHEDNKDLYDQARDLRKEMHDILIADEFDKDAFLAKSAQLRKVHDTIGANLDDAFADASAELSVKDRQTLASAMEQEHKMNKAKKKAAQ